MHCASTIDVATYTATVMVHIETDITLLFVMLLLVEAAYMQYISSDKCIECAQSKETCYFCCLVLV